MNGGFKSPPDLRFKYLNRQMRNISVLQSHCSSEHFSAHPGEPLISERCASHADLERGDTQ